MYFLGNVGTLVFEGALEKKVCDLAAQLFRYGTFHNKEVWRRSMTAVYALRRINFECFGENENDLN